MPDREYVVPYRFGTCFLHASITPIFSDGVKIVLRFRLYLELRLSRTLPLLARRRPYIGSL